MQFAFIVLAFSQIALFVSIQSYLQSTWGRIGLALMLVNTLGLFLAGIFVTDSILTPDVLTKSGQLHNLGGSLGIAGFLVSIISLGIMLSQSGGKFGPDVLVGWPNRFSILAACIWLIVVAYQAMRLNDGEKI